MKKILTFIVASFFGVAVYASEVQPQVILRASTNYDVKIDNNFYNGNGTTIPNLGQGNHRVEVYQVRSGGIFGVGRKRVLVSTTQFYLRNNDVVIDVDQYGSARIYDNGYNGTNNNQGRDNNGNWNRNGRGNNNNDDRYDNSNSQNGRGNKYGHYKKNKKNKHQHGNGENDDDDDDNNNNRRRNNDDN